MGSTRDVIFNAKFIYILTLILPLLIIGSCWGCYYGLGHNKGTLATVMTISETVISLPEMRIFATGMTVESLLIATVFFLRDHCIESLIKKKTTKLIILKGLSRFCAFLSPLALITLSNFNVKQYWWPHMVGAFTFFITTIIYFICYDWMLGSLKRRPNWVSIATVVMAVLSIAFACIGRNIGNTLSTNSPHRDPLISASSCGQYLAVVFLAIKCCFTLRDLPNHGIKFSQKQ